MGTILTNLTNVHAYLGIPTAITVEDTRLNLLITRISAMIEERLHRTIGLTTYTDYYSGTGTAKLVLRNRPVVTNTIIGTLTAGSPNITSISPSTVTTFIGEAVTYIGPSPYPSSVGMSVGTVGFDTDDPQTNVVSVSGSPPTITVNNNATVSGPSLLVLGPAIFEDWQGCYGQGPGSFQAVTALQPGVDYVLDIDQPDGQTSRSGIVYKIQDVWWRPTERTPGILSTRLGPSRGSIKVIYQAGYSSVPTDLQEACEMAIAKARQMGGSGAPTGTRKNSDGWEDYHYSVANLSKWGVLDGEVGAVLARYQDLGWSLTGYQ